MVSFPLTGAEQAYDFEVASDGGVALYLTEVVLTDAEAELSRLGYDQVQLDAATWVEDRLMHADLAAALGFPEYYGHNTSALRDCLRDVACGDYGWDPTRTGLVVAVRGFGSLARRDPGLAELLVDVFTHTSRTAMLFGHRLLWLLRVDDPQFDVSLGLRRSVRWDRRETLTA